MSRHETFPVKVMPVEVAQTIAWLRDPTKADEWCVDFLTRRGPKGQTQFCALGKIMHLFGGVPDPDGYSFKGGSSDTWMALGMNLPDVNAVAGRIADANNGDGREAAAKVLEEAYT